MRARLLVVVCAVLGPGAAGAQMPRMNLSGSLGLNLPIGELDKQGQPGFGVAIRTALGDPSAPWSVRNSFTFDRFGGRQSSGATGNVPRVDNYQYLAFFQFDLIHNTNSRTYQYVGVGLYQFKQTFEGTSTAAPPTIGSGGGSTRTESDPGFQGGVGLNFGKSTRTFVEVGVVSVQTSGKASSWFPLRFGIRL